MDVDSAGFVLDRVDLAREALLEARQVVEKYSQQEDAEVARLLDQMLASIDQLDAQVRGRSYQAS